MMTLLVGYAILLWWGPTGAIMALYGRSRQVMRRGYALLSLAMLAALAGVLALRGASSVEGVALAVGCGVVIWGWQTAGYYLGFVTGPAPAPTQLRFPLPLQTRFRIALRASLYHELLVIALGVVLALLSLGAANPFAFWIYLALALMHTSAKLNVFLGVRNFRVELLPSQMHYLGGLLGKGSSNWLFPISLSLAVGAVALLLAYAAQPETPLARQRGLCGGGDGGAGYAGAPLAGVAGAARAVEPDPAPQTRAAATRRRRPRPVRGCPGPGDRDGAPDERTARPMSSLPTLHPLAPSHTAILEHPAAPLVVDVWQARQPAPVPPILLIHGWGGTGSYWAGVAAALSETATVIVPDLPGTGRSQPVRCPQNLFDQVDSLVSLLDQLALAEVQVVGHSMGSAMALLMADSQPARVERLLLTSLSFFVTPLQEQVYWAVMGAFNVMMRFRPGWLANVPGMPEMMGRRYFHRLPDDRTVLKQGWVDYLHLDGGTAAACAHDAPTQAIPAAGARVQVPTLLVACRQTA
ncbi:MAG: alpha/beta fold hydrolase [Anaerolineae bacterium]|nr:alpha/beta fold hydrolase [Anaerolineae bacterium]